MGQSKTTWIFPGSALMCPFSAMFPTKEMALVWNTQKAYFLGDVGEPFCHVTRVHNKKTIFILYI